MFLPAIACSVDELVQKVWFCTNNLHVLPVTACYCFLLFVDHSYKEGAEQGGDKYGFCQPRSWAKNLKLPLRSQGYCTVSFIVSFFVFGFSQTTLTLPKKAETVHATES